MLLFKKKINKKATYFYVYVYLSIIPPKKKKVTRYSSLVSSSTVEIK